MASQIVVYRFFLVLLLLLAAPVPVRAENDTPLDSFSRYKHVLEKKDQNQWGNSLNQKSKAMMQGRSYSSAMMAHEARNIEGCGEVHATIKGKRAVVYFMTKKPTCNPYFMHYEEDAWRVDLYTMSRAIRFDGRNHWRFDRSVKHPYTFIFQ